jgi:hypothetical protein
MDLAGAAPGGDGPAVARRTGGPGGRSPPEDPRSAGRATLVAVKPSTVKPRTAMRNILVAVGVVALAASLAAVAASPGDEGGPRRATAARVSFAALPVVTPDYAAIAIGAGRVFVLERGSGTACGTLAAVSPLTLHIEGRLSLLSCPDALAYGDGAVWVLSSRIGVAGYDLTQVSPSTLVARSTTVLDGGPNRVTPQGDTGDKYAFVTTWGHDLIVSFQGQDGRSELVQVTASRRRVVHTGTVPAAAGPVTALSANAAATWVGTTDGWVLRYDPASGSINSGRHLGTRVVSLAASNAAIWVACVARTGAGSTGLHFDLLRLDPHSGRPSANTGLPISFVAADGSSVWGVVTRSLRRSSQRVVGEIDPRTGALRSEASLEVHGYEAPDTVGVGPTGAWVENSFLGTLTEVRP